MGGAEVDRNIGPSRATTAGLRTGDETADRLAAAIQTEVQPRPVPVNVYETTGALVVVAAMPGVGAEDISVTVEADHLWIRASARTLAPKAYLLHEWTYGPYERRVDLPAGFEGDVDGSFGNGQLALRVLRGGRREGAVELQPAGYVASPVELISE